MEKGKRRLELRRIFENREKLWRLAGLFLAGLVLAGGKAFAGGYPLGLAALGAAGGLFAAAAVFLGTLIGSADIGGIFPLAAAGLFVLRGAISLWIAGDRGAVFPAGGDSCKASKRKSPILRYTRASGWVQKEADTDQGIPRRRKREPDSVLPGRVRTAQRRDRKEQVSAETLLAWAEKSLFEEHISLRMAFTALAAFGTGAWAIVNGGFLSYDLWGAVLCTLLSPVITYIFYAATDRRMRTSAFREAGILGSLALLTRSLSGVVIPLLGLNLGEGAALAAAVLAGGSYGGSAGGLVGLSCGLFLEPLYAPAYALAGLVTGWFSTSYSGAVFALGKGGSRSLGMLAGMTAVLIWCICSGGYSGLAHSIPEVLVVSAVVLPFYAYDRLKLPPHWCGVLPDTGRSERTAVAEMVMAGREKKLTALGDGMRSMGEMLGGVSEKLARPGIREMRDLAERCFEGYCDRCAQQSLCREQEFSRWQGMLGKLGQALTEEGGVSGSDIPPQMGSRCGVMGRILDDINHAAALRIGERRSGDRLRVAAEDYTHIGRLLAESARLEEEAGTPDRELTARLERILASGDFSAGSVSVYGSRHKRIFVHDIDLSGTRMGGEEIAALFASVVGMPLSVPEFTLNGAVLSMEMHTRDSCRCEWGKCARAASSLGGDMGKRREFSTGSVSEEEQAVPSGDTVTVFTGDGRQYMLISDGMGTGRMAALTSGMAAVFLERMLMAGAGLETALKMLNNVIRAGCDECAATVDLCEIDMVTLEARFVKSGAAPSFVIRGGSLFRLQSKTVPIGILRALDAEMIRFTVEPGDVIVMLSDGIARSFEECPWLLDFISTDEDVLSGDVQRAAEKIVEQAAARGARDDITAGVMRVVQ
ncbi:MAG: SpoIIE family protein phosphatase [Clostridia bacterium]|nr:SpoIIE family protein phosphatase [Clostridia bacterium]